MHVWEIACHLYTDAGMYSKRNYPNGKWTHRFTFLRKKSVLCSGRWSYWWWSYSLLHLHEIEAAVYFPDNNYNHLKWNLIKPNDLFFFNWSTMKKNLIFSALFRAYLVTVACCNVKTKMVRAHWGFVTHYRADIRIARCTTLPNYILTNLLAWLYLCDFNPSLRGTCH